jgi:hypothetical protein
VSRFYSEAVFLFEINTLPTCIQVQVIVLIQAVILYFEVLPVLTPDVFLERNEGRCKYASVVSPWLEFILFGFILVVSLEPCTPQHL